MYITAEGNHASFYRVIAHYQEVETLLRKKYVQSVIKIATSLTRSKDNTRAVIVILL